MSPRGIPSSGMRVSTGVRARTGSAWQGDVTGSCRARLGLSGVCWFLATPQAACLRVQVADDGMGGADPDGRGLRGLAERLAEHGGRLDVLSQERGGTTVVAEIPLNDGQRATIAPRQVEAAS